MVCARLLEVLGQAALVGERLVPGQCDAGHGREADLRHAGCGWVPVPREPLFGRRRLPRQDQRDPLV
jgi:hypothetical protein